MLPPTVVHSSSSCDCKLYKQRQNTVSSSNTSKHTYKQHLHQLASHIQHLIVPPQQCISTHLSTEYDNKRNPHPYPHPQPTIKGLQPPSQPCSTQMPNTPTPQQQVPYHPSHCSVLHHSHAHGLIHNVIIQLEPSQLLIHRCLATGSGATSRCGGRLLRGSCHSTLLFVQDGEAVQGSLAPLGQALPASSSATPIWSEISPKVKTTAFMWSVITTAFMRVIGQAPTWSPKTSAFLWSEISTRAVWRVISTLSRMVGNQPPHGHDIIMHVFTHLQLVEGASRGLHTCAVSMVCRW